MGAKGNKLSGYFEWEEHTRVPNLRIYGPDKVEEARRAIASEVLERLHAITPEKILDDIKSTLNQHYDKGLVTASPERSYHHKSEYVELSAHRPREVGKLVTIFMMPARGYDVLKEGHRGVYYPMYYVELAP